MRMAMMLTTMISCWWSWCADDRVYDGCANGRGTDATTDAGKTYDNYKNAIDHIHDADEYARGDASDMACDVSRDDGSGVTSDDSDDEADYDITNESSDDGLTILILSWCILEQANVPEVRVPLHESIFRE